MQMDWQSAKQLRDKIAARQTSSVEATKAVFARIAKIEPIVGAYISTFEEQAIARAAEIDKRIAGGEKLGQLAGVPVAVKDNMCTTFGTTTCASKILANFHAPYNATVVEKLLAADAVIIGKTNLDEFAMGSSTENSGLKQTVNPWDTKRVPGGSSGGSTAAVAAGLMLCRTRFGYGRLDKTAGEFLRRCWFETHIRTSITIWPCRLWFKFGPDWANYADSRGLRPDAERHSRSRPG